MRAGKAGRITAALLVALVATGVSGCERQVSGPTLVLRLATPDKQTDPTGPAVQHFAEEVAQLSGGTIRIDPMWDVTPDGAQGWDQTVAEGVARGTWEMGLVPGRAWDLLGVDSLRALNTPFLITNQAALRAVLDSDLRDGLLGGLPAAGVTGIDLFPDGLRHPFGYDDPLLDVHDYADQTIWSPTSEVVAHMFGALGATTDDSSDSSSLRGAESQFDFTPGQVATGNVTFFPKTNALVLRTSVRTHLRDDQWALLRAAGAATRQWLYAEEPSDQQIADIFCKDGGSIVAASPEQLGQLEKAVQPTVQWLRSDPDTRRLIDAIGDVVKGVSGEPPSVSCPAELPLSPEDAELASLDGTYVTRVTQKQLREAGVPDRHHILENSGRTTWVLNAGTWTFHQTANHHIDNPDGSGNYTYRDGVLTLTWDEYDWTSARLQVDKDGTIHFSDIHDALASQQALSEGSFKSPWTRVGGVPEPSPTTESGGSGG
jgi:TRAP-type C4-dicarboxylate transport system substrate-binding protein